MQDLENNNWIIWEFMWNNFGTLRELIQNNTIFVKVQITQYWNFQRDTTKQDILCQS